MRGLPRRSPETGWRMSSRAIQQFVEANGFSVVREFVGHGVGRSMHEEPQVPNYVDGKASPRLRPGMTIAIEPMVNAGAPAVRVLNDGWTVVSEDGLPSAHFEHTVLVTEGEPEILTCCPNGRHRVLRRESWHRRPGGQRVRARLANGHEFVLCGTGRRARGRRSAQWASGFECGFRPVICQRVG